MKKLVSMVALVLFASPSFADWKLEKFDVNNDRKISLVEMQKVCKFKVSVQLFKHADKNGDGVLNRREAANASKLLKMNKCGK